MATLWTDGLWADGLWAPDLWDAAATQDDTRAAGAKVSYWRGTNRMEMEEIEVVAAMSQDQNTALLTLALAVVTSGALAAH